MVDSVVCEHVWRVEEESLILTELIRHWWLANHFGASCVLMPAIRTPIFRVKLKEKARIERLSI